MPKNAFANSGGGESDRTPKLAFINPERVEFEPFVDAERASNFLAITKRRLLELARGGQVPAHPIGTGERKTWRFRLSELADSFESKRNAG
jgi:hypothetical protein